MARQLNLFESATKRTRIQRQGDLTQVVIDGGGAFVVMTQDFTQVQKWAQSKAASQNAMTDRGRMFEQFGVLISRPGTQAVTRGHSVQLEKLAKAMKQGGFDLGEWSLPPEMKHLTQRLPEPPKPKAADAAAAAEAADVDPPA